MVSKETKERLMPLGTSSAAVAGNVTSSELAKHNKQGDLWISIMGKVYNVTDWAGKHPGGDLPILTLAGQDVTDAFLAFHPGTAWLILPQFLVGHLVDYEVSPLAEEHRKLQQNLRKAGLYRNPVHVYCRYGAVMLVMLVLCWMGVLFSKSFLVHLCSAVLLGFVWIQSGFMGHDTGHSGMLKTSKDKYIKFLVGNCLTGISMAWWGRNHNAHHFACNCADYDPDIQYMPLFAVSNKFFSSLYSYFYERKMDFDGIARVLVSYQHFTYYPVMALARINLYAQSLLVIFSKRRVRDRGLEIITISFFYLWFFLLLSFLPSAYERAAFVLVSFAVTGIQHVQFTLNHFSSPVYEGRPESKNWVEAQVRGTLNLTSPAYMDWFHGGLHFQIEHHLFPTLPRHNLRKISPYVKSLCEKFNLPYNCATFWQANVMLLQTLRTAALQARDTSQPSPKLSKNLVWEGLKAVG